MKANSLSVSKRQLSAAANNEKPAKQETSTRYSNIHKQPYILTPHFAGGLLQGTAPVLAARERSCSGATQRTSGQDRSDQGKNKGSRSSKNRNAIIM